MTTDTAELAPIVKPHRVESIITNEELPSWSINLMEEPEYTHARPAEVAYRLIDSPDVALMVRARLALGRGATCDIAGDVILDDGFRVATTGRMIAVIVDLLTEVESRGIDDDTFDAMGTARLQRMVGLCQRIDRIIEWR